ncbi:MAG: copper resistance protein CopZ [Alphaproteobacteria bacterium]|nr:copper resistance protein CopZ [Alphaproteobacteria bacterium]
MRYLLIFAVLLLAACNDEARDVPPPLAMSEDALGHYCQMHILEHTGPKGQVHLAGYAMPIWFSQVRDGLAYIKLGERIADVTAFYVNDMGKATDWGQPGDNNWLAAESAYYVVGSDAVGGMGAPELVPFGTQEDAVSFARERGGMVKRFAEIVQSDVLAPVEIGSLPAGAK